uniref:Uncharacterized protein n=1 Tax=viral metagenome TaxID=1070528 RepID=A0A6C0BSN2_9ZZZZ
MNSYDYASHHPMVGNEKKTDYDSYELTDEKEKKFFDLATNKIRTLKERIVEINLKNLGTFGRNNSDDIASGIAKITKLSNEHSNITTTQKIRTSLREKQQWYTDYVMNVLNINVMLTELGDVIQKEDLTGPLHDLKVTKIYTVKDFLITLQKELKDFEGVDENRKNEILKKDGDLLNAYPKDVDFLTMNLTSTSGGRKRKTRRNKRKNSKKSRKATKGKRKSRRKTSRRRARK